MTKRTSKLNKNGSALIAVMCVLFIFLALILAMTLASYQVLAHTYQYAAKEQARITVTDYSKALEKELNSKDVSAAASSKLSAQIAEMILQNANSDGWKYYNKDEADHNDKEKVTKIIKTKFYADKNDESIAVVNGTGDVTISMYWKFSEEDRKKLDADNPNYKDARLIISVSCNVRKQTYTRVAEYEPHLITESDKWTAAKNWYWSKK